MNPAPCIGLVDDDPVTLRSLRRLLTAEGYEVSSWPSARELLAATDALPDCLVLDVDMPGLNGLELQARILARGLPTPVIFLTGAGDIPMTVQAMKAGAVNFLTKPAKAAELLAAIRTALELVAARRTAESQTAALRRRYSTLTPREREVVPHLITGRLNKQIAAELGTSEQTIKIHRMRILSKIGIHSVAELVRVADALGISPAQH